MEVKPGYKQTEVGVIPEAWEVTRLPEVSWFQEGPGLRNWQFTNTGMKVINVTNLEDGVLNLERTDRHISNAEFNRMYRHFAVDDDGPLCLDHLVLLWNHWIRSLVIYTSDGLL